MSTSRREFLKLSAAVGAATLVSWRRAYAYERSPLLRKFIQPLPTLGPGGIPVAQATPFMHGIDSYQIVAGEYTQQLHPELPPTKLWGYADATTGVHRHLGPVIVARRGTPVRLSVTNALPDVHPLPVDVSLPGAELASNRMALHLHGGFVPWVSDGGPFAWFDPNGGYGPSAVEVPGLGPRVPGTFTYYYPNDQSARLLWYHDHAVGITRLNAYAGLASAYVLRDLDEASLVASGAIPSREIPLVIQDKIFKTEPDAWGLPGDLWYPSVYEPERWEIAPPDLVPPVPSCVPEFFGDTMLVNGVVYPTVRLEPRRYRLRVLNACNARFCSLRLFYAKGQGFPDSTEADLRRAGPSFTQIGTEGGFLPAPVLLDGARPSTTLLLAPAERADLIVDFSAVPAGSILVLYNDAPAPYPMGDRSVDFDADARGRETPSQPGFGPNTRTLLQFVIGPRVGADDDYAGLTLPSLDPSPIVPAGVTTLPPGVPIRDLTLNEDFDAFGRLIQRLGTTTVLHDGTLARDFEDPPTETPKSDSVEAWRIFNLTGDTHPVHFHLVNVQVVSRQPFDARRMRLQGSAQPPDANERGWKETVRMNPGECTTVIMKFTLPSAPFKIPTSPRTGGHEYVWHCHILEHEEHDMMRPLIVG